MCASLAGPWRPFLLTFVVIAAVLTLQLANNMSSISPFNAAHWVWDYSLGFVKRGLLGAVTEAVFGPTCNSYAFIERASLVLCLLVYLSYALFAASAVAANPSLIAMGTAVSGALFASALPIFAYDMGRLDQLGFGLTLLACLAILRLPLAAALACVVLSSAVAMLVHEAHWILRVPMLLAIALLKFHARDGLPLVRVGAHSLAAFLVLAAVLGLLLTLGSPTVDETTWRRHWEAQAAFLPYRPSKEAWDPLVIHYRSMADNLRLTLQGLDATKAAVTSFTLGCIVLLVTPIWFRVLQAEWIRRHQLLFGLTFLSLFSPAAMFLIGLDYMRWNSAILTNAVIGILCLTGMGSVMTPLYSPGMTLGNRNRLIVHERASRGFTILLTAAIAFVALTFPQTSGVVDGRPVAKAFARTVQDLLRALPRRPEHGPVLTENLIETLPADATGLALRH